MYIPGRSRTGSRPFSTVIAFASYATREHPFEGRVGRSVGPGPTAAEIGGFVRRRRRKTAGQGRFETGFSLPGRRDAKGSLGPVSQGSEPPARATATRTSRTVTAGS